MSYIRTKCSNRTFNPCYIEKCNSRS